MQLHWPQGQSLSEFFYLHKLLLGLRLGLTTCLLLFPCFSYGENAQLASTQNAEQRGNNDERAGSTFGKVYEENCAVCHGGQLQGAPQGVALVGNTLKHGDDMAELITSISKGFPEQGMPAWEATFDQEEIKSLALWISEFRQGLLYSDFRITAELEIPTETQQSEVHPFRIEKVAEGLDPLPYSIAPLPDGSILVTEKMRGLRVVYPDGSISELIQGTPTVYDDTRVGGGDLEYGMGWLLDVAIHPDYVNNGWIYLHYTDRCERCNDLSREHKRPVSMNALMRGRIKDGHWVDEEVLYKADLRHYSPSSDVATGGRIAFDPDGFVFISIGMQSIQYIQDLHSPHGKILRLKDNGEIPSDNPFVDDLEADHAIWSYGHRSPQGLEFNAATGQLWATEHGPRGGDEVNLLLPGKNYGWPLFSKGQNYDGSAVSWGKKLGLEVELKDTQQPIVDLTPSPAISSFIIYTGDAFPQWRGQLIAGSLKAADLFRLDIQDNKLSHQERLIDDLARIRDVEMGNNGEILLLLEHANGSQIVRLVPDHKSIATTF